jgi:2-polyprenyl-3-methyl-5-hydroxy-6-metoxy-1,4-benzoquinol methylase
VEVLVDAVEFYSSLAMEFHSSYQKDANRLERVRVFEDFVNRYAAGAAFAYDVGCGSGVLACEMARRGIDTIGIDGASAMLAIAKNLALERGLSNVRFEQHTLPIANTTGFRPADIIISSSALEYFTSFHESLCFVRKLLSESGVVIFSVSNHDAINRKIVRWVHRMTGRPRYLKFLRHFMDVKEIRDALSASGLVYLEHAYFARADQLNRFLGLFLPPRLSSNMIIVAARRQSQI